MRVGIKFVSKHERLKYDDDEILVKSYQSEKNSSMLEFSARAKIFNFQIGLGQRNSNRIQY